MFLILLKGIMNITDESNTVCDIHASNFRNYVATKK